MENTIYSFNKKNKNKLPKIKGPRISLIPIPNSEEFYKLYYKWMKNPEIKKAIGEEDFHYTYEEIVKMHDEWKKDLKNMTFCILDDNQKPIGDINILDSDEFNGKPEISLMIAENAGKGFGTEATKVLIDFAFKKIKLNEIYLSVYQDNIPAIKIYQKLGFNITDQKLDEDGRPEYLMKITEKEFKFDY